MISGSDEGDNAPTRLPRLERRGPLFTVLLPVRFLLCIALVLFLLCFHFSVLISFSSSLPDHDHLAGHRSSTQVSLR